MFQVDDYVNYSSQGICRITGIQDMKFGPGTGRKPYYLLRPVHGNTADIFVPVDNAVLVARMRPVLTPQQIDDAILASGSTEIVWEPDRKKRTAQFQEILSRREEHELLALASCLHRRQSENAKGFASGELQILRKAEQIIEQEFSFSLQIEQSNVGSYIHDKMAQYGLS